MRDGAAAPLGEARLARLRVRAERLPGFDPHSYRELNGDVGHADPLDHYVREGLWRAHAAAPGERMAAVVGMAAAQARLAPAPSVEAAAEVFRAGWRGRGVRVHVGDGERPMRAARLVVDALAAVGVAAKLLREAPAPGAAPALLVDPSRLLGDGDAVVDACSRGVVFLTRGPDRSEFAAELPFALLARGVASWAPEACALLSQAAVAAHPFASSVPQAPVMAPAPTHPFGPALSPRVRGFDPAEGWDARPLDVMFIGRGTPARLQAMDAMAEALAEFDGVIHCPRPRPVDTPTPDVGLRAFLASRARVALNLHPGRPACLDWVRLALEAMPAGAVVVSEAALPHPLFKPGLHYLEEDARRIPALLRWLLRTPDGRVAAERVRRAAQTALAAHASPSAAGLALGAFLLANGGLAA